MIALIVAVVAFGVMAVIVAVFYRSGRLLALTEVLARGDARDRSPNYPSPQRT